MVNLSSPKTFKAIKFILGKKEFTQYKAKNELGLGMSTVNNLFKYLTQKNFIKKKPGSYELIDPVGLIEAVSFFHSMNNLLFFEKSVSVSKQKLMNLIPKGGIFCLESALEKYGNYFDSSSVSVYLDEKQADKLKKCFVFDKGNNAELKVFIKPKFDLGIKEINGKKFTDEIQTVLDLACDKKGAMADKLIEKLWGVKVE